MGLYQSGRDILRKTPLRPLVRWLRSVLRPAPEEYRVMKQVLLADSNCIDVGANDGQMLGEMMRLAPDGSHYAFEPIKHLADE